MSVLIVESDPSTSEDNHAIIWGLGRLNDTMAMDVNKFEELLSKLGYGLVSRIMKDTELLSILV